MMQLDGMLAKLQSRSFLQKVVKRNSQEVIAAIQ